MDNETTEATKEKAKVIRAINTETVHKICSGQVVLSLAIAVKELVENALDAGATLIEIKLREYGLESIEVADNGSGIEENNFEGLAARYHTSKIREFSDLEEVATFGFRGEALNSLCTLSEMKVVTKHHSVNVATKLELNHRGEIVKRTPCARQTGTTITLANLFASLPVRKREFERSIQKEYAKMCQILQAYGLISYGKRIILSNHTAKGGRTTIMSTNGSHSLIDNIVAIFGAKQNSNLLEIRQPIEQNETLTQEIVKSLDVSIDITDDDIDKLGLNRFRFEGYISSTNHGCGRSTRDRQYFFINGRPCDPKFISKLVNDTYHRYNLNQNPFIVLNIILERREVDVNLTPDKRQILVSNETILRLALKKGLLSTFGQIASSFRMESSTRTILSMNRKHSESIQNENDENASETSSIDDDFENRVCNQKGDPSKFASMLSQWRSTGSTESSCNKVPPKRKGIVLDDIATRNLKMRKIHEYLSQDVGKDNEIHSYKSESDSDDETADGHEKINKNKMSLDSSPKLTEKDLVPSTSMMDKPNEDYRIDCKVKAIDTPHRTLKIEVYKPIDRDTEKSLTDIAVAVEKEEDSEESDLSKKEENCGRYDKDIVHPPLPQPDRIVKCNTTISNIQQLMALEYEAKSKLNGSNQNRMRFKTKIDPSKNKVAEQELETEISKDDFARMEIIGQFNLGFIIGRLDDDLFIIDQHATDEKYNFETLQKTTCIQHQPMVKPQSLGLTAINEIILKDNIKVFEMNGFRFDIDMTKPVTERVKLIAKPFSRNWEFGKEDIDELLFMLQESGNSDASCIDTCRPSRVRAMFASRACRSSVMIGTSLSNSDMRRLVDHMGSIEQPWNCPHGRPTIRHLLNLALLNINDQIHESTVE